MNILFRPRIGMRLKARWFRVQCMRRFGMTPTELGTTRYDDFATIAVEYNRAPFWRKLMAI